MGRFFRLNDEPVPGYKLVEWIGSGQFGQVWKAAGPGGVPVAMKIIESAGSVEGRKELRALRLLKNIRYVSLVPLIGFWLKDENDQLLDDESLDSAGFNEASATGLRATQVAAAHGTQSAQLFIAMGLGDKTLFHRMSECQQEGQTGIPVGELITYMKDAADAIDYLNKKHNIIHCDIKPQNILIISERAQVCDFGLAKAIGNIRQTVGGKTLGYSAPEVDRGEGPGHATDQYSLAASYYELRTGHLPFHEDDARSEYTVVKAKCEGRLDLSRVTEAERRVLQQAMAPDPDKRFAYCRKFIKSLLECFPDDEAAGILGDPSIFDSDPGPSQPAASPSIRSSDAFTQTIVLSDSNSGSAGAKPTANLAITSTNASRETRIPKDTKAEARAPVQPAAAVNRRLWPIVVSLAALAAGAGGFAAYHFGLIKPPGGGNVRDLYADQLKEHDYVSAAKLLTKYPSTFEGNDWLQLIREWSEIGNTDAAIRGQIQQTFPSNDIDIPEVANELRAMQERWLQRDNTSIREARQLVDKREWPAYTLKEKELEPILSWLNAVSDVPLKDAAQQLAWQFEVAQLRRDAFRVSESSESDLEDNWSKLSDRADDLIAKAPTAGAALAASDLAAMTLQLRQIKVRGRLENKSLQSDLAARTAMIGEVVALGGQDGNALGEPEFEPALEKFRAGLMEQVGAIFKKSDRTEAEDRLMREAQKLIPSFATFIEYASKYEEFKAEVAAERFAQARAALQRLRELRGLEKSERDKIELAGRLLEWIDPEGKSSPEFSQFLADLSAAARDDARQGEWAVKMATGAAAQAQQWLVSDEARANAWTEELLKPAEGEDAIKLQPRLLPLKRILIGNRLVRGLFAAEQKVGDFLEPLNALEPETLNSLPLQIAWNEARLSQQKPDLRDIQSRLEKLQKDLPRESDPSLASYYDYVVALTQRAQDGDSSQATKNMLAALSTSKTVTGAKWSDNNERREQVLQILVQQMEKLAPNNSWLLDPNRQISQELRDLAESAETLATGLPEKNVLKLQILTATIIAADLLPKITENASAPDETRWSQFADRTDPWLADDEISKQLDDRKVTQLFTVMNGLGHAVRGKEPDDRKLAAERLSKLCSPPEFDLRAPKTETSDFALRKRLLEPATKAIENWDASGEDTATRQHIGAIYLAMGRVTQRSGLGNAKESYAYFSKSNEWHPRFEALVGKGRTLLTTGRPKITQELGEIVEAMEQFPDHDDDSGFLGLRGIHRIRSSRSEPNRARKLDLLNQAITNFKRAMVSKVQDEFESWTIEWLSQAHLESAFHSPAPAGLSELQIENSRGWHLDQARRYAQKAIDEYDRRFQPENAYNALGNAYEDHALYLGDVYRKESADSPFQRENYVKSIEAFSTALGKMDSLTSDAEIRTALTLWNRGRSRFRFGTGSTFLSKGDVEREERTKLLASDESEAMLNEAEADLKEAIKLFAAANWTERQAETYVWLGRLQGSFAAIERQSEAEKSIGIGINLAKEAGSSLWSPFVLEAIALANSQENYTRVDQLVMELTKAVRETPKDLIVLRDWETSLRFVTSRSGSPASIDSALRSYLELFDIAKAEHASAATALLLRRVDILLQAPAADKELWKGQAPTLIESLEKLLASATENQDRRNAKSLENLHKAVGDLLFQLAKDSPGGDQNSLERAVTHYQQALAESVSALTPQAQKAIQRYYQKRIDLDNIRSEALESTKELDDHVLATWGLRYSLLMIYKDKIKAAPDKLNDFKLAVCRDCGPMRSLKAIYNTDPRVRKITGLPNASGFDNVQKLFFDPFAE